MDGNFVETSLWKRIRRKLSQWLEKWDGAAGPVIDWAAHEAILRQAHFSMGLTPARLRPMLEKVGFTEFVLEDLERVRSVQRRAATLSGRLKLGLSDSFILSCEKPLSVQVQKIEG